MKKLVVLLISSEDKGITKHVLFLHGSWLMIRKARSLMWTQLNIQIILMFLTTFLLLTNSCFFMMQQSPMTIQFGKYKKRSNKDSRFIRKRDMTDTRETHTHVILCVIKSDCDCSHLLQGFLESNIIQK